MNPESPAVSTEEFEELRQQLDCLKSVAKCAITAALEPNDTKALADLRYDLDSLTYCWNEGTAGCDAVLSALKESHSAGMEEAAKICDEGVDWQPKFPPNVQRVADETTRLLAKAIRASATGKRS